MEPFTETSTAIIVCRVKAEQNFKRTHTLKLQLNSNCMDRICILTTILYVCVCAAGVDSVEKKRERFFNVAWTQHSCQAHTLRNERSVQCFLLIIIFRKSIQIWKERTLNKVISERLWAQLPCTMAAMLVHAAWTWTGTHQFTCESHRAVHNLIPGRKINMRNTVCCSHSTQTHKHTHSAAGIGMPYALAWLLPFAHSALTLLAYDAMYPFYCCWCRVSYKLCALHLIACGWQRILNRNLDECCSRAYALCLTAAVSQRKRRQQQHYPNWNDIANIYHSVGFLRLTSTRHMRLIDMNISQLLAAAAADIMPDKMRWQSWRWRRRHSLNSIFMERNDFLVLNLIWFDGN